MSGMKKYLFTSTTGAITDTALHTSAIAYGMLDYFPYKFNLISTLDDDVTIKIQGSDDGQTWHDLIRTPGTITLTAGTKDWQTLAEAWEFLKVTAQATIAPTTGALVVTLHAVK